MLFCCMHLWWGFYISYQEFHYSIWWNWNNSSHHLILSSHRYPLLSLQLLPWLSSWSFLAQIESSFLRISTSIKITGREHLCSFFCPKHQLTTLHFQGTLILNFATATLGHCFNIQEVRLRPSYFGDKSEMIF